MGALLDTFELAEGALGQARRALRGRFLRALRSGGSRGHSASAGELHRVQVLVGVMAAVDLAVVAFGERQKGADRVGVSVPGVGGDQLERQSLLGQHGRDRRSSPPPLHV
jgi:hypothetical protein